MQQTTLLNTPINLIIFDCDGVLIDSETLSKRVLLDLLSELNVKVSSDYFEQHFLGRSFEHVSAKVLEGFEVALPIKFRENYQHALMQTFDTELKPTIELEKMLAQLNVPYCVATSSSVPRVKHALTVTDLMPYFSGRIFTCSEVKNGKPAPDIFLHAAKEMGFSPNECLVIEDSEAGMQAANAANMQLVRYVGASHLRCNDTLRDKIVNGVTKIQNWDQLFELIPSLHSAK
jgi:HAD superfamily hydrolase (TIGR01509 family)